MARVLAVISIVFAIGFAVDTVKDERRGVAEAMRFRGMPPLSARKQDDPSGFSAVIAYEWLRAGVCLSAALGLFYVDRAVRRADQVSRVKS